MPHDDAAAHAERIRALDADWLSAVKRRDLDGMMAIYAVDAQELLPGMPPVVGRNAIRTFYASLLQRQPRLAHHFEPQQIMVGASGDLAVVRGTYRFTADALVPAAVQVGKFVGVWRHEEGDWRLVVNISNGAAPGP